MSLRTWLRSLATLVAVVTLASFLLTALTGVDNDPGAGPTPSATGSDVEVGPPLNAVNNDSGAGAQVKDVVVVTAEVLTGVSGGIVESESQPRQTLLLANRSAPGDILESESRHAMTSTRDAGAVVSSRGASRNFSGASASYHVVQKGESLVSIAKKYGLSIDTVALANNIADPNRIKAGEQLIIPPAEGLFYTVQSGDTLWEITRRYKVSLEEVAVWNKLDDPGELTVGAQIFLPGADPNAAYPRGENVDPKKTFASLIWPVTGKISSPFGPRWGRQHSGVDIAAPRGTPINAALAGRVVKSARIGGYGNTVILDHGDSVLTLYAHASKLSVKEGEWVNQGEVVGYVGSTGNSTGPHVHFELIINDRPVDPLNYLSAP